MLCRAWLLLVAAITTLVPQSGAAWGAHVHVQVNVGATQHLPAEFAAFAQWADSLGRLSTAADARRCCDPDEEPRHYIDIDDYDEFFSHTLPHDYAAMVARFGRQRVDGNGIVPWAIETALADLTRRFRDRDWPAAVAVAADLGHYVADSYQPLHLTMNYDGQWSGQRGIHSRYESALTEIYFAELEIAPGHVSAYARPLEAVFAWIEDVYPGMRRVMRADARAQRATGGDTRSPAYFALLWQDLGADTQRWIRQASLATASLWLTAWYDAGSPALPGASAGVSEARLRLLANEPNPFNPRTTLRFEVPAAGPARLRVLDVRGRVVRTLLAGTDPGRGERSLSWDGRDDAGGLVASGSYRIRLEQAGRAVERSAVLVR